jgi:hypothetical protein
MFFRLKAKSMIKADDEALDPWKQAEKELGDAAEPRAHAVQGFLYNEMEFCYGHGSVAAVNPVGHTSAGLHMCGSDAPPNHFHVVMDTALFVNNILSTRYEKEGVTVLMLLLGSCWEGHLREQCELHVLDNGVCRMCDLPCDASGLPSRVYRCGTRQSLKGCSRSTTRFVVLKALSLGTQQT